MLLKYFYHCPSFGPFFFRPIQHGWSRWHESQTLSFFNFILPSSWLSIFKGRGYGYESGLYHTFSWPNSDSKPCHGSGIFQFCIILKDSFFYCNNTMLSVLLWPQFLIPLFSYGVYPLVRSMGIKAAVPLHFFLWIYRLLILANDNKFQVTPLRRMVCGMFLASMSFVVAAMLQKVGSSSLL